MKHCIMMFILCIMTIVCLAEDRYIEQRCDKCNNELVKCSMCKGRGYDLSNRQCKKCRGKKHKTNNVLIVSQPVRLKSRLILTTTIQQMLFYADGNLTREIFLKSLRY